MTIAALEKALKQPRPFALHLTDGRKITVPHPEFIWLVPPNKSEMVISYGKRGGIELLRVNRIVSIYWPDNQAA